MLGLKFFEQMSRVPRDVTPEEVRELVYLGNVLNVNVPVGAIFLPVPHSDAGTSTTSTPAV